MLPCSNSINWVCQKPIPKYKFERPLWKELVPGKEYAVLYRRVGQSISNIIPANYFEARHFCQRRFGAQLAEPASYLENEQLVNLVGGGYIWLGFNDIDRLGHWVKQSDGAELTYSNWDTTEPWDNIFKRGRRHCAIMFLVSDNDTGWGEKIDRFLPFELKSIFKPHSVLIIHIIVEWISFYG